MLARFILLLYDNVTVIYYDRDILLVFNNDAVYSKKTI